MTEQNNVSLNPKAPEQERTTPRSKQPPHQLIAIGGAIGTGLFMAPAALLPGGPP